jgi:hypothetical protein
VLTDFYFPDWPPRRLVLEAVTAWRFRHLDEEYLDVDSAPWASIRGAVLAFLRHNLTDYDERLRVRCERDEAYRDDLAEQIAQVALRRYPWLTKDPRPFPKSEDSLFLDAAAKELASLHSIHDHLFSAIKDLKRTGNSQGQITALQRMAASVKERIRQIYSFLIAPKISADGDHSRALLMPRTDRRDYYFFSEQVPPPNRLVYTGFQCPRCNASVARRKQTIAWGQGYDRVLVWSCHCLTYSVYKPPGRSIAPMMAEDWGQFVQRTESEFQTTP